MSGWKRNLLWVAVGIIVLVVGSGVALVYSARRAIEREATVRGELVRAYLDELETTRPVVHGEPVEGNAIEAYRSVDALWPEGEDRPRLDPEELASYLEAAPGEGSEAIERLVREVGPGLAGQVATALRRRTLDWGHDEFLTDVDYITMPDSMGFVSRRSLQLLGARAHGVEDPRESLRLGMLLVGAGEDQVRARWIVRALAGSREVLEGCVSVLRSVDRKEPSPDDLRRTAEQLLRVEEGAEVDLEEVVRFEHLAVEGMVLEHLAREGTLGLEQFGGPAWSGWSLARLLSILCPPAYRAGELAAYGRTMNRTAEAAGQSWVAASADIEAIERELTEGGHPLVRTLFPVFRRVGRLLLERRLARRTTAVLLDAGAIRRETGSWPADGQELVTALGRDLPVDPFSGRPLVYHVDAETDLVGCYRSDATPPGDPASSTYERRVDDRLIGLALSVD